MQWPLKLVSPAQNELMLGLHSHYSKFRKEKYLFDATIESVEQKKYDVHKLPTAAASSVLDELYENKIENVHLQKPYATGSALSNVTNWIYTGSLIVSNFAEALHGGRTFQSRTFQSRTFQSRIFQSRTFQSPDISKPGHFKARKI